MFKFYIKNLRYFHPKYYPWARVSNCVRVYCNILMRTYAYAAYGTQNSDKLNQQILKYYSKIHHIIKKEIYFNIYV